MLPAGVAIRLSVHNGTQAENKNAWGLTLYSNKRSLDILFPRVTKTLKMNATSNSEKDLTTNQHERLK
jgi:hypothetical protein